MKHETARQDVPRVRIRRARAGLQRRSHPEPVPHRARQDPAEPVVGDVRAASASARDLLTGFVRAYTVLVAAAFVVVTLFAIGEETLLGRAIRAGLIGGVAAVVLARVELGGSAWDALHWEARRQASAAMRLVVEGW